MVEWESLRYQARLSMRYRWHIVRIKRKFNKPNAKALTRCLWHDHFISYMYINIIIDCIRYAVGSIYKSEDCQQCSCTLGGIPFCIPKKCDPCSEPDMQVVVTELCGCICKPCPYGERYCPTSNVCLNETLWCNGVQDCPDDERNCSNIETSSVEYFESTIKSTTASINTPSTTVSGKSIVDLFIYGFIREIDSLAIDQ